MKKIVTIGIISCALLFVIGAYGGKMLRRASSAASQDSWNSAAIKSAFAGVQVREVDPAHAAVVFLYDLDNRTNRDFQLSPGASTLIMKRLKDGSLSSDPQARLVSAAFVPVHNRTRIALEVADSFNWPATTDSTTNDAFRRFVRRESTGLQGFVIFDRESRYQIELPVNLPSADTAATSVP